MLTSEVKSRPQLALQLWGSVKRVIWSGFLVNGLAASGLLPNPVRAALLRLCGIQVMTSTIRSGCHFTDPNVTIGSHTFVNHNCFFDAAAPIRIGQRCGIGMESLFCTATHRIGPPRQRMGQDSPLPITVGDGCWIGARAVILPGVSIGAGCIIAAGAVVNRDCSANGLYAGVPARRVRELSV